MKVGNNQNPFIFLLPTGTYHENLVIWIFISSNSGECRPFFSQEKLFVEVEIIFFRSKFGRVSPQRKTPVPIAGNTKVLPASFCLVCPQPNTSFLSKEMDDSQTHFDCMLCTFWASDWN
jgi:hypothetical protein